VALMRDGIYFDKILPKYVKWVTLGQELTKNNLGK
jgi:hypothetical protein